MISRSHAKNARTVAGVFFFVVIAQLLTGCATPPQTQALLTQLSAPSAAQLSSQQPPPILPAAIELTDVPYYAQDLHQCGPATLAMAIDAAGAHLTPQINVTPEQLVPQVYLPGREGSLQVEMLAATRRQGLLAYTLAPQLRDLLSEIAAGHPVVVLQNLALSWYPRWHYAIAIGYDLNAQTITLRSGPESRQQLSLKTFEYTWARSSYWAMLALPPDQIPTTATAEKYLDAALALESTAQTTAARSAYRAATLRWPDQFGAFIGLGNSAYKQQDFVEAETAFRSAIIKQPDSAIAHNNLADTLMQQGQLDAALHFAETAVWLGGEREPAYAQTLAEIKIQLAQRAPSQTYTKKSVAQKSATNQFKKKTNTKKIKQPIAKKLPKNKNIVQKKSTKKHSPSRSRP